MEKNKKIGTKYIIEIQFLADPPLKYYNLGFRSIWRPRAHFGPQHGGKIRKKWTQKVTMGENENKNKQNSQTRSFFSWLPRKCMKIGVSVHMGTKKRLLASEWN